MGKIWYCANCGYEVPSRGRCHLCRSRLVASSLPQLDAGDLEDEVGYRLDSWSDGDRGLLILELNEMEVLHRFEGDELVVAADDEERVDDLISRVPTGELSDDETEGPFASGGFATPARDDPGPAGEAVRLLASAAKRLREDPTDMQADGDVAEASAVVFIHDDYSGADAETWAAVGRVTRRLLAALGADEALDDQIRSEASILSKLLDDLLEGPSHGFDGPETLYEMDGWNPEQRAQLGLLLEEAGIPYEWDDVDNLVVASDRESEAEALFDRVGGPGSDDDEEIAYSALEELYAAADRLASDPENEQKAADAVKWLEQMPATVPVGFDEFHWLRITRQARTLSEAIDEDRGGRAVGAEAATLRDLIRTVV